MESVVMFANKLEFRYYFNDRSMYIDAMVRNKCEKEMLSLIHYVAELLDVKMMTYSEPYQKEGGYSDIWCVAGRNPRANSVVLNVVMRLITQTALSPEGEPIRYSKTKLQEMTNELRLSLKNKKGAVLIPHGFIPQLSLLPRIGKSKAIVYEAVKSYSKVTKIVLRELNENNRGRSGSLEVKREQFAQLAYAPAVPCVNPSRLRKTDTDKQQLTLDLFGE